MDTVRIREGFHHCNLESTEWNVPKKYQLIKMIGIGAYGQVCSAYDIEKQRKVAIKKIYRPFCSKLYAKRTFSELKMLMSIRHENVISLLDVFTDATNIDEFKDLYFVMTLMVSDLSIVIKTHYLKEDMIRHLTYQMLKGVKFMHSAGIIHRDLKPSNIALSEGNVLKILDFGLARPVAKEMTGYVVTRWYRAPEIVVQWMGYDQSADIWSIGAIMAEMFLRKPLFPCDDSVGLVSKIIETLGKPSQEFICRLKSEDAKGFIHTKPDFPKTPFREFLDGLSDTAFDLLENMLKIDPQQRITATHALRHPFFRSLYNEKDEQEAIQKVENYASKGCDAKTWREMTYREMLAYQEFNKMSMGNS